MKQTGLPTWSAAQIAELRRLWAEGHTTAEIGRRMGLNKNKVIGKAHRLHLPGRPSPLPQREPVAPVYAVPRPPLATPRPPAVPRPRPVVVEAPPRPTRFLPRKGGACCWPVGEPRTAGFRYCDEATEPGKPYCEQHALRARRAA